MERKEVRGVEGEWGRGVRGLLKKFQPQSTPPLGKTARENPSYLLITAPQNGLSHDVSACIGWDW
jgi:hypothetical protein